MKIGIFHTAFIGDIVLTGLLVEALYQFGHEIVFFTKSPSSLIFEEDIRVKKVVVIKKQPGLKKLLSIATIAQQIRHENCDILLVPHKSLTSTLCAKLSQVPLTIGFNTAAFSFLYTIRAPFYKNTHECLRYLSLIPPKSANQTEINKFIEIARPILRYKASAFQFYEQKFPQFSALQKKYFVLAPGSVWATKKYTLNHWVEVVIQYLIKHNEVFCILAGSLADKKDINDFLTLFQKHSHATEVNTKLINSEGMFTLSEYAIFISQAQFVLSNDSSPIHFASAFNVPVVSVFGPTAIEFGFAPTSEKNIVVTFTDEKGHKLPCQPCSIHGQKICPLEHHKCMTELKPEKILKAIENLNLY